jgi:ABC-type sugar transport system permease subunit
MSTRGTSLRLRGERRAAAVLIGPAVVGVVLVLYVPTLYVAFRSFFDWRPNRQSPFVGFDNYSAVLASDSFRSVVKNQLFLLLGLPLWVIVPLLISFLLYEGTWLAVVWRTIYFVPGVLSPALIGILFRSMLATNGPVNEGLRSVGLDGLAQNWLSDPSLVKPVIILLVLWSGVGIGVVIFSSALSAVPTELFEAAQLDGAGWIQRMRYVAIPSIRDSIVLWAAYQVLALVLFMFGWIYVLTGGGPGLSSTTMDFLIYQEVFRFGFFGTAAAQAVLMVLAILAVLGLPALLTRRRLAQP